MTITSYWAKSIFSYANRINENDNDEENENRIDRATAAASALAIEYTQANNSGNWNAY